MTILDTIVAQKRVEVEKKKLLHDISFFQHQPAYSRNCISLKSTLQEPGASGIIAEFKRKSPSKGWINASADPITVTSSYQAAGASGISILTDETFFGGNDHDLVNSRPHLFIPILRKEFIVDPFQVYESKSLGADLILLIAACLTRDEVAHLSEIAHDIGLEVLLELHDEDELDHVCDDIDFVGINNRSLKTFEVNIERSLRMAESLPADKIKIAESGIEKFNQISMFRENGYKGFLIGESFMKYEDPGKAFTDFVENR
jgi:indole-3-glycerol phosphate synthase